MKKMKRACALLLSMAMLMALAACGGEKTTTPPESGSTSSDAVEKIDSPSANLVMGYRRAPAERGMSLAAVLQIL